MLFPRMVATATMLLSIVVSRSVTADPLPSFHMTSLPGISIIQPTMSEFLPTVTALAPHAQLSSIQPLLKYSYVLKNTNNKSIIAYSARWTLTDLNGHVTYQDRTWWNLSTLKGGDVIAPGESRLVSPAFRLETKYIQQAITAFSSKATVVASLETVIFDDGQTFGSDATNASVQAQAYLDAQREVLDSLVSPTYGDVPEALSKLAEKPKVFFLSNPPQYGESLARYQYIFASALIRMLQQKSPESASAIERMQQSVNDKRNLNIVRR